MYYCYHEGSSLCFETLYKIPFPFYLSFNPSASSFLAPLTSHKKLLAVHGTEMLDEVENAIYTRDFATGFVKAHKVAEQYAFLVFAGPSFLASSNLLAIVTLATSKKHSRCLISVTSESILRMIWMSCVMNSSIRLTLILSISFARSLLPLFRQYSHIMADLIGNGLICIPHPPELPRSSLARGSLRCFSSLSS